MPAIAANRNFYSSIFRERKGKRQREREHNIDLLLHLLMHSLVDSCMCPDQGWNSQPWQTEVVL